METTYTFIFMLQWSVVKTLC